MSSPADSPQGWSALAFNQATESENKIHSDDVARRYGFRGGLVPGVTVFAYLVHPAVCAWGLDWLESGAADVRLRRPVYDGERFRVELKPELGGYRGSVLDPEDALCADGQVVLGSPGPAPPPFRGDPPAPAPEARPDATREALERLRERGLGALHARWRGSGGLERYTRELRDLPDVLHPERGGYANPAYTLGLANAVLAANVRLGPWIHVESQLRNLAAIPRNRELRVEARVLDLFERGGHEFVDLEVGIFGGDGAPFARAHHRAIYQLREPEA